MSEQKTSTIKEKSNKKSNPTKKQQDHKVVAKKPEGKKPQKNGEHSVVKGKKPNTKNQKKENKSKSTKPTKKRIEFGWFPFAEYFGAKKEEEKSSKTENK